MSLIERVLRRRGYLVKKEGIAPRGFSECLAFARRCGIAPATVYDVGVGLGTPWLYDAFPGAQIVLVEAMESFRPTLERIALEKGAKFHVTALGAEPGVARLRIPGTTEESSSMFSRSDAFLALERGAKRDISDKFVEVPVVTLDSIATEKGPCVLKVDVEGAELAVLAGGPATLGRAELVLLELSVLRRFDGEPSFAEAIAFMDRHGFELFDIPELSQTSARGALSYVDAAFVRKDRTWTVPEW